MSELMNTTPAGVTQNRAYELHQYIIAQARVAGQAISEIGRSLKEMRDSKLYLELGHETFEAYTEDMLNIKQRQAYNYISIYETYGPKFIDANANLGISKLLLLQAVPVYDREEFMEEHDVGDLTTRELKELTEKYTKACEQLSLLQTEKEDLGDELIAAEEDNRIATEREQRLQEQKIELEKRIKELEARPVDVAVAEPSAETLAALKKEAAANQKEAIAKAVEKAEKKAAKDAEEKIKEAKEAAKKEAEEALQASLRDVEREKAAALERAKAMEKQLSLGANPDTVLIKHLFDELQSIYNRLMGTINKLETSGTETDTEAAAKFRSAVRKLLEMLVKQLEG